MDSKIEWPGVILISLFFIFLAYAGYISYQSIDWKVLQRLESQPLVIPTQAPVTTPTAIPATPSAKP